MVVVITSTTSSAVEIAITYYSCGWQLVMGIVIMNFQVPFSAAQGAMSAA